MLRVFIRCSQLENIDCGSCAIVNSSSACVSYDKKQNETRKRCRLAVRQNVGIGELKKESMPISRVRTHTLVLVSVQLYTHLSSYCNFVHICVVVFVAFPSTRHLSSGRACLVCFGTISIYRDRLNRSTILVIWQYKRHCMRQVFPRVLYKNCEHNKTIDTIYCVRTVLRSNQQPTCPE